MPTGSQDSQPLLGESLVTQLRLAGFTITENHYIRMISLLDRLDGQCHFQDLRTLLCPIFATAREEQESFYRVFDGLYPHDTADRETIPGFYVDSKHGNEPPSPPLDPPPNSLDYLIRGMGLFVFLAWAVWFFWANERPVVVPPTTQNSNGSAITATNTSPSLDQPSKSAQGSYPSAPQSDPRPLQPMVNGEAQTPVKEGGTEVGASASGLYEKLSSWRSSLSPAQISAIIQAVIISGASGFRMGNQKG